MPAWKNVYFFSVLKGLAMVIFAPGQELLKFYFTKDKCVKAKVKSQYTLHLITVGKLKRFRESFKWLENNSYNRVCELAVSRALRKLGEHLR